MTIKAQKGVPKKPMSKKAKKRGPKKSKRKKAKKRVIKIEADVVFDSDSVDYADFANQEVKRLLLEEKQLKKRSGQKKKNNARNYEPEVKKKRKMEKMEK